MNAGRNQLLGWIFLAVGIVLLAACSSSNDNRVNIVNQANNAQQWAGTIQLGVAGQKTVGLGVATDAGGNRYVTGYTTGGLDGNSLTGITDLFLTKFNSSGTKLFTKQLGFASQATAGTGVATDVNGNVFVTGYTSVATVETGTNTLIPSDVFLVKFDSSGTKLFTVQLGVASQATEGTGVAIDAGGNVYVTGYTTGGLDGNGLTGTSDFFLTKFDNNGTKLFTKQLGVVNQVTYAAGVATDAGGNVYVTGYTTGGLAGNTLTGNSDFFLTKFNSIGTILFTTQLGVANQATEGTGVAIDASGNVYVTGDASGGLDGNTLTGISDFFLSKFDGNGTKLFTKQLGVADEDTGSKGVATDSSGNVYVTGITSGGLDGNTSTGDFDLFLTKFDGSGTVLFTRQLGVADQVTDGTGVVTDGSGNVFMTGTTYGGLNGDTLTGISDFFLVKLNASN